MLLGYLTPSAGAMLPGVLRKAYWPLGLLLVVAAQAQAQAPIPGINVTVGQANTPEEVAATLQILIILTVLTLAPAILIMTTSFTRIIIVLAFIRQALGTNQSPPTQVLVGLALFLTFFVMEPVWSDINQNAFRPFLDKRMNQAQALDRASAPLKAFMQKFVREKDLALFVNIAKLPRPRTIDDVPFHVIVPAFITSELKTAFQIGFLLYVPFLVVDLVVASVLMAMGMMMLPPIMISLPLKLMLFVLVDGWNLIIGSLVGSFFVR